MSVWPQHRQASVIVRFSRESREATEPKTFGCSQSKRNDWRVKIYPERVNSSTGYVSPTMKMVLYHLPVHQTRLTEVTVQLDADEVVIRESVNTLLKADNSEWSSVYVKMFVPLTGKQDAAIIVKYEVDKETGQRGCICSACKNEPHLSPLTPTTTLADDYHRLFVSRESSDVVFAVAEEEIPAHKLVLTTRLPYFERLFASGMRESRTNRIVVDDIDACAFKEVLKFIYCGVFPKDIDSSAGIYLPIAEKYGIQELKEKSSRALRLGIRTENVIERVIMAHLVQCSSLKETCFCYLKKQPALGSDTLEPLKAYPDLLIDYMSFKSS